MQGRVQWIAVSPKLVEVCAYAGAAILPTVVATQIDIEKAHATIASDRDMILVRCWAVASQALWS